MKPAAAKPQRCAIYTRGSTENGLEQEFNSLHAQREAAQAYIKSQAHEGWKLIRDHYDDGGLSGGSVERPGLRWLDELTTDSDQTIEALATREGKTERSIRMTLSLAFRAQPAFGKRNFAAWRLRAAFGGRRPKTPPNGCRRPALAVLTPCDVSKGDSNCEPLSDAFVNFSQFEGQGDANGDRPERVETGHSASPQLRRQRSRGACAQPRIAQGPRRTALYGSALRRCAME